jgi:hypothetical protein
VRRRAGLPKAAPSNRFSGPGKGFDGVAATPATRQLQATLKVESSSSVIGAMWSGRLAAGAGVDRDAASPGIDGASDAFARAHEALLRGKDLQFQPTAAPKPPDVPTGCWPWARSWPPPRPT